MGATSGGTWPPRSSFLAVAGLGPIALFGISMGAVAAILSAPDLPVAAVVADAAYAELQPPDREPDA